MANYDGSSIAYIITFTLCILFGICLVKYLLLRLSLFRRPFKKIDLARVYKPQVQYERNLGVLHELKSNRSYNRTFSRFQGERVYPSHEIYQAKEMGEWRAMRRSNSEPQLGWCQASHAIQLDRPGSQRERGRSSLLSNSRRGYPGLLFRKDHSQSWNFDKIDTGKCNPQPQFSRSSWVLKGDRYQRSCGGTSLEWDPIRKVKEPRHYSAPRVHNRQNCSSFPARELKRKEYIHKDVREPCVPNIKYVSCNPEMRVGEDHFYY